MKEGDRMNAQMTLAREVFYYLHKKLLISRQYYCEYNYAFIFDTVDKSYCSDLISKAYNRVGYNLNKDGVIVTDNISFHGFVESKEEIENKNLRGLVLKIRDYIDFLKNHPEYETKFYKVGDGIAITYKKEDINE